MKRKNSPVFGRTYFVSVVGVLLFAFLTAFTGAAVDAAGHSESEQYVTIANLEQDPIKISLADLQEFSAVNVTVTAVNASGRENTFDAEGVLFADVLTALGFDQAELQAIRLVAGDGYSIEVAQDILAIRDILLAYSIDGEPLAADAQPLRAIIPEERAMYWVRNLVTIEVLHSTETPVVEGIRFLDTIAGLEELVPYEYHGSTDQALAFATLIAEHPVRHDWERLTFTASDDFVKHETKGNAMGAYLKLTGDQAPVFLGPDLPGGMHVKDITFLAVGGDAFVSMAQVETVLGTTTIGETTGVAILDLFAYIGMADAAFYEFAAADGYAVQVAAADLAGGLILFVDGALRTYFHGLPRNTAVRDLYSVNLVEME